MQRFGLVIAVAAALALGACSDGPPGGNPAAKLRREMRGYSAPIGVMMGENETPYWAQGALAGFRPTDAEDDVPATIEFLKGNGGCTFGAPTDAELLAKVQVDGSAMKAPVFAVSNAEIGKATETYIANVQRQGDQALVPVNRSDNQLGVVDVVVTETAKPVYLVLSYSLPTIFNIHLAEGARLSRIAMVGLGTGGVANVDPSVPIHSLTGQAMRSCGVLPVRSPAKHWLFVRNVKETPSLQPELDRNIAEARAYSNWFRSNFRTGNEPDAIGASETSQVLVGPLPDSLDTRVAYRPLADAAVRLSANDLVFGGSEDDFMARKTELIVAAATKFAGGDLNKLKISE